MENGGSIKDYINWNSKEERALSRRPEISGDFLSPGYLLILGTDWYSSLEQAEGLHWRKETIGGLDKHVRRCEVLTFRGAPNHG